MMGPSEHDYIQSYESVVSQLLISPEDKSLQHQAVLALARAGSLDFAISEYERYGLSNVKNDEDIMALSARLSKDLYLRNTGKAALEHARDSAHKYEAAFQNSSGYYSGINAATMAFMADMPSDIIKQRASTIHQALPNPDDFSSETRYFIEATRAESLLLVGEEYKAKEALQIAMEHDPLNYTAHATTLKQFRMILNKLNGGTDVISEFTPPKSIHYAGHIFGGNDMPDGTATQISNEDMSALSILVTDVIQQEDIGFGYGALAAGADILIAESLLQEGAELHLVLPTNVETFISKSVLPFGKSWKPRFEACLKKATSLSIISPSTSPSTIWPNPSLNRFAGQAAMGQAILRAKFLAATSGQLLLWNQDVKTSYTSTHARDWQTTGRSQTILPFPAYKAPKSAPHSEAMDICSFQLVDNSGSAPIECSSTENLVDAILKGLSLENNDGFSVHVTPPENKTNDVLSALAAKTHKNQVLISETAASILSFTNDQRFQTTYAGCVPLSNGERTRAYSLHIKN